MTRTQARRRLGAAARASKAAADKFNRDEITEREFWDVLEHEECLRITALGGEEK